jgi:hypothetical protein
VKLVIYINDSFEEEKALYDLDNKRVILKGDDYHDKINYIIEGYLFAMEIDKDDVEEVWIDTDHELFKELDFYDGN